ncbi:MAG: GNAT family N-acetyltransferase [Armatimonadetes bacterium]|nr:GNAT family N-acetyltransferase [Armatimonadota bacterium]
MLMTPRRKEFQETDRQVVLAVLREARYGHLAAVGRDGQPEVWPLNYALVGEHLYFHGSPQGFLGGLEGCPVCLSAEDTVTWIPSSWRHPHLACPATTFYRSARVQGKLERVEEVAEKARALSAFMERYQPEGDYRSLEGPEYLGPLKALQVMRLELRDWSCRVKLGQHLPPAARRTVHDELAKRGDRHAAARMRRANPDLRRESSGGPAWTDDPDRIPVDQLHTMLKGTYWAADRSGHEVAAHLHRESTLSVAGFTGDRLVAYARLATPGRGIAYLFDVVVREDQRGTGLGSQLMERILEHPRTAVFPRIFLDTRDAMAFYRRFGFVELRRSPRNGGSTLMLRELLEA